MLSYRSWQSLETVSKPPGPHGDGGVTASKTRAMEFVANSSKGSKKFQQQPARFLIFPPTHDRINLRPYRNFPGSPVAKTPYSQGRGPGLDAWSGN